MTANDRKEAGRKVHFARFIHRVEKLEDDKDSIAKMLHDIYTDAKPRGHDPGAVGGAVKEVVAKMSRDICVEVKSKGFDPKVILEIVKMRRMNPSILEDKSTLIGLYKKACLSKVVISTIPRKELTPWP